MRRLALVLVVVSACKEHPSGAPAPEPHEHHRAHLHHDRYLVASMAATLLDSRGARDAVARARQILHVIDEPDVAAPTPAALPLDELLEAVAVRLEQDGYEQLPRDIRYHLMNKRTAGDT